MWLYRETLSISGTLRCSEWFDISWPTWIVWILCRKTLSIRGTLRCSSQSRRRVERTARLVSVASLRLILESKMYNIFLFIKYGFKNWRFDSYKSSEGFEYLFYSITIIMSHSHVPRRHAIVQICLVSFQLKIHNWEMRLGSLLWTHAAQQKEGIGK